MSYTFTRTHSETGTREVASRVAADLELMRIYYGTPPRESIADFEGELQALLAGGYVARVEYGFKMNGARVVCLCYEATYDGRLTALEDAGGVHARADITGASFYSYLWYSASWWQLPSLQRARIENGLPVSRTAGPDPADGAGVWVGDRTYVADGRGVVRSTFRPR